MAAASMATLGVLTVLVGAWAGIVPFVGALFSYSADGSAAWTWNQPHVLLWLAPGAVAVATGLFMLLSSPRVAVGGARVTATWAGLLAAACGGWLVVGMYAWPVLGQPTVAVGNTGTSLNQLADKAGWTFGPGLVLVLLGGCAFGLALALRRVAVASTSTAAAGIASPEWTPVT